MAAAKRKAEPSVTQDMLIMMSAFMRNGRRLCSPFRLDARKEGEEVCGRAHLCAAVLHRLRLWRAPSWAGSSGPRSRSRFQPPERDLFLSRRHLGRDGGARRRGGGSALR